MRLWNRLFRQQGREKDLDEELRTHLRMAAREHEEARRKGVAVRRRRRNHPNLADDGPAGYKTKNSCRDPKS